MRIVLIQPPIEDFYSTDIRLQPIGLAYLKAAIKSHFPEVDVIVRDYHHGYGKRSRVWPKELLFLKDFYPFADRSPFSTFYHYYHFGASYELIVDEVARLNPDLVGISVLFSAYAPQAFKLASELKKLLGLPILLGGSHVSAAPESTLSLPFVDFVIYGEGERPMVALVDAMLNGKDWRTVPNLGYKKNGRLIFNAAEDNFVLDTIPFPDFSDLNSDLYKYGSKKLSFIVSSRSCPYRCAFCSVHQTFGIRFRQRSVENILSEIAFRHEKGYRVFDFEDDNLNFDRKRMIQLLQGLESSYDQNTRFMAMNGLAYFRLDSSILQRMQKAGFRDLNISLVSRNERILRAFKRPYHFERFEMVVNLAAELNMNVISYQILGLPGDSVESMLGTLIYQSHFPVTIGVSPFYYTEGMPIQTESLIEKPYWVLGRLTSLGLSKNTSEREAIYTMFILARMVNFLKQLSGIDQDVCLRELLESNENWKGREWLGLSILKRLLKEKQLFGFSGNDFKLIPKFRYDVFQRFMERIQFIKRTDGKMIRIKGSF